jgi:hypothetical protein
MAAAACSRDGSMDGGGSVLREGGVDGIEDDAASPPSARHFGTRGGGSSARGECGIDGTMGQPRRWVYDGGARESDDPAPWR